MYGGFHPKTVVRSSKCQRPVLVETRAFRNTSVSWYQRLAAKRMPKRAADMEEQQAEKVPWQEKKVPWKGKIRPSIQI